MTWRAISGRPWASARGGAGFAGRAVRFIGNDDRNGVETDDDHDIYDDDDEEGEYDGEGGGEYGDDEGYSDEDEEEGADTWEALEVRSRI